MIKYLDKSMKFSIKGRKLKLLLLNWEMLYLENLKLMMHHRIIPQNRWKLLTNLQKQWRRKYNNFNF